MKKRTIAVFIGLLSLFVVSYALADQAAFLASDTLEVTSDELSSEGISEFLAGAPNITGLTIEEYYTGEEVTLLGRGGTYIFWIWFDPTICDDYYNEIAVVRGGRIVYSVDWEGANNGNCGISGTGIVQTVPGNAPFGNYTWGARTTNSQGQDVFYPHHFSIQ